jgi:hypothetical protein
MRRFALALLLLVAFLAQPSPAPAEVRNCTSALVTAGLCPTTSHVLLSFAIPSADTADLQATIAALIHYDASNNTCTAGRIEERLCSQAELGQVIAANSVVSRWVRAVLIARVREYRAGAAAETARQASLAGSDPAIP